MIEPGSLSWRVSLNSDRRRPYSAGLGFNAAKGARGSGDDWSVDGSVTLRPSPPLQIEIQPSYSVQTDGMQYVTATGVQSYAPTFGRRYFFADLRQKTASLEGRPVGVVDGGILEHTTREVEVSCLPTAIPDFLRADVSEINIGHSIPVSSLVIPEGVELLTNPDRVLATVQVPRVVVETVVAPVEGAEPGAVPAEGEAAAAPAPGAPGTPAAPEGGKS